MKKIEVLILGAGPGGLCAARECAERGVRVHVVEKRMEIGSPIHTSGATWIGDMEKAGIPASLYHRIEIIRFLSPGNQAVFKNARAGICVLDVRGVFQYLASQAIESGATLSVGTRAIEPLTDKGKVVGAKVQTQQGEEENILAMVTIDATGFTSLMARKLDLFQGFQRYGLGLEYDLYAPRWPKDEFVLLVGSQIAPTGYAWIFPWGTHRVRAGVGVTLPEGRGADLKTCLERLIWSDERFAARFHGASPIEMHRGFIPDEPFPVDPYGDGFIIIGDAASQASVLAGEGIRFAMEMGKIAGRICSAAVKNGDFSKHVLSQAHAQWNRIHGRDFRIALDINTRIAAFSDAQWDKGVEYLKRLSSSQFLSFLKTEFSLGLFMGIIAKNPGLAGKTLMKMFLKQLKDGTT